MIIFNLIILIFFSIVLIKATDLLVSSLKALAKATKIGKYAITGFILAIATSLPELFVGAVAALEGKPALALGNVLGSNIADITIVVALGAIIGGGVVIKGNVVYRDLGHVFAISLAPFFLLLDKKLSRVDGLLLLVLYAFYTSLLFRKRTVVQEEESVLYRLLRRISYSVTGNSIEWAKLFIGIFFLIFSADIIVKIGVKLATVFHIPLLLIGIFLIAIGTSLPEIVFEVKAILKKEASMAYGDILGSVVANATLVLGVTALISPITIQAFSDYLIAVSVFLFSFAIFVFFIRTKRRLDRWEGVMLLIIYAGFVLIELIR